jgi:hypothetical protein
MYDVVRRKLFTDEDERQNRHYHGTTADAEQAGEKPDKSAERKIRPPPIHELVTILVIDNRSGLSLIGFWSSQCIEYGC